MKLLNSFKIFLIENFRFRILMRINPLTRLKEMYEEICYLSAKYDTVFGVFRRQPDYRLMVEPVTNKQGEEYLRNILRNKKEDIILRLEKYKENDIIGSPIVYSYSIYGNFSPTTLRYIKVLSDLNIYFGSLNNYRIVEIGGGYGGQCKIVMDSFKPKQYTLIDLPVVIPLIQKYLDYFNIKNTTYLNSEKVNKNIHSDLAVSNYAFSEISKNEQDKYLQYVFKYARRGYITYNAEYMIAHYFKSKSYSEFPYTNKDILLLLSRLHKIKVIKERPYTAKGNIIIVWGLMSRFD